MGQSTKRVETMKLALVFVFTAWITNTIAQRGPGPRVPGREPGIRGRTNGFEMLDLTQEEPFRRGPQRRGLERLDLHRTPGSRGSTTEGFKRGPPGRGSTKQNGKRNNNKEDVQNQGNNCWEPCGEASGPCPNYCGDDGFCCRRGSEFVEAGCSGKTGGRGFHTCVSKNQHRSAGRAGPTTEGFKSLGSSLGAPGNRRGPPIMSFEELNERRTPGRRGPPRRGSSKQKGKKNNNKENVRNEGRNCWNPCGKDSGPCPNYCGVDGLCCRQGSEFAEGGCDGKVGASNFHTCVAKPSAKGASRTQQGPPRSLIERGVLKGPYRACQNVVGNGRFTCPQGQNQTVFPEKECSELTPSMDLPSLTSQKEAQVCQEVGVELTIIGCWVCVVENAGVISVAGSVQGVDLTVVTTCKESGEEGRPANDGQCSLT